MVPRTENPEDYQLEYVSEGRGRLKINNLELIINGQMPSMANKEFVMKCEKD